VQRVDRWRRYALAPVFALFSDGFWNERRLAEASGSRIVAALCKGILARLHGKFLQRDYRWTVVPGALAPRPWWRWSVLKQETGERQDFRSIGWEVQVQRDAGDAKHCFPALAAWVTAWGREYVRSWWNIAGRRDVLYFGTDALIVTEKGKLNLEK